MKIKNKLTLVFTLIMAIILTCLTLYIYFISRSFRSNAFYNQLKDRAITTATVFLEADERSSAIIKTYQAKYLQTLPDEVLRVYDEQNKPVFIDSLSTPAFDSTIINKVRRNKEFRLENKNRQTLGIFYEDNQGDFVIVASAIDRIGLANLAQLKKVLLLGLLSSLVLVFLAGRYITKLILNPIAVITSQANRISDTHLHLRLNEGNRKDELAQLSITINQMLYRLENSFNLQKQFVSNASHELRNPLASIIGNIEVTLTKPRDIAEHEAVLLSIQDEAEKLHRVTNGLLDLAYSNLDLSNKIPEEVRLDELLIEIRDEMKAKRPGNRIELVFPEMPANPSSFNLAGDRHLLSTALLNIVDNACKFSGNKPVIISLLLSAKTISIKIKDNGIGIAKEELPMITETFYRAENARTFPGSGIGLALADKIIKLYHGTLSIISQQGEGTEVTLSFPVIAAT